MYKLMTNVINVLPMKLVLGIKRMIAMVNNYMRHAKTAVQITPLPVLFVNNLVFLIKLGKKDSFF